MLLTVKSSELYVFLRAKYYNSIQKRVVADNGLLKSHVTVVCEIAFDMLFDMLRAEL